VIRSFAPGGIPTAEIAAYNRRRAEGEVCLILSEGTVVDRPASSTSPKISRFHGEQALAGWKAVVDGVHAASGAMAPRLWHQGVREPSSSSWLPPAPFEGPSGLVDPGRMGGVAMTEADIEDTVQAFARAAADARRLGFDAVEIHGALGYLIDQFFWEETNRRADAYVWRDAARARPVRDRGRRRDPRGCRRGLRDHSSALAVEAAGFRVQARQDARGDGGVARAAGENRRGHLPPVLDLALTGRQRSRDIIQA
jgi:2,4-dienoyl-CoA reductase-like NADH-dependent reductase (Old Yellow Enzyme family)